MATAMEPKPDSDEDLLDDLRPKSPYGEPLGKFHVTTEWPQPLPRSRHARRPRADPRYRTQPVTFDEIREVDEDSSQGRSPKELSAPRTLEATDQQQRITELKCPIKLEALNAAILKVMKRPADVTDTADDSDSTSHTKASDAAEMV